ncbi:pilus assembly protein TadG-related protein [Planomonospora algeriensis]
MNGFAAGVVGALLLLAGIVVDGGLVLAARVRAVNEAYEAARSGARQLDFGAYRRDGEVRLDPGRARSAALAYVAETSDSATVDVSGDTVTVVVRVVQPPRVLGLAGVGAFEVSGRASVTAQRRVAGTPR